MTEECLVSQEALAEARRLMRNSQHVEAAALLMKNSAAFDARSARSCRDGGRVLAAAMRSLTMDSAACLGLDAEATAAEVKTAYRSLARVHHPDKTNGATHELFQVLTAAYAEQLARTESRPPPRVIDRRPERREEEEEDDVWEKFFWRMTRFKLDNGHCYCERGKLGQWGVAQRLDNETGHLLARRRRRLEAIGFNVDDKHWRDHLRRQSEVTTKTTLKTQPSSSAASSSSSSSPRTFFCGRPADVDDDDDDDAHDGPAAASSSSWWFSSSSSDDEARDYEISLFGVVLFSSSSAAPVAVS